MQDLHLTFTVSGNAGNWSIRKPLPAEVDQSKLKLVLQHGMDFHAELTRAHQVFVSVKEDGFDIIFDSVPTLDDIPSVLAGLVDRAFKHVQEHDLAKVSLHPLQAITDDVTPFVPFDTEERD